MVRHVRRVQVLLLSGLMPLLFAPHLAADDDLSAQQVLRSIERAKKFLERTQTSNGSWNHSHTKGATALAVLALVSAGADESDPTVARGMSFLRRVPDPEGTYETALMIMALTATRDSSRDRHRVERLVRLLEQWQFGASNPLGGWSYGLPGPRPPDNSNSQYALLGLREAQLSGVNVGRRTWERAREYWKNRQLETGGWGYDNRNFRSTGSMTVAGIASIEIINMMLPARNEELKDGNANCCGDSDEELPVERGISLLGEEGNFSVRTNPGSGVHWLYYLYGLERAGRLTGTRHFGRHDWYREGADILLERQDREDGGWHETAGNKFEKTPVVGTSMALLFLAKGLAPVLIQKLQYGPAARAPVGRNPPGAQPRRAENWNVHRKDVLNLAEVLSQLPRWPRLLVAQDVNIHRALEQGGVKELLQAPVLFINGPEDPAFTAEEIRLLRDYVDAGGFILAEAACERKGFDRGFRALVPKMFPNNEATLRKLTAGHPVYASEFELDAATTELWGVDIGCRTCIIYSADDWACLWNKWSPADIPERSKALKERIRKSMRIGANILAYATARQLRNKLEAPRLADAKQPEELGPEQQIHRGFLQIAKLRHGGDWDAAPHALTNLLRALNRQAGVLASPQKSLELGDSELFKFPLLYMHGRDAFAPDAAQLNRIREYLRRGGVLFADACCGSPAFDRSMRDFLLQLFPEHPMKTIPADHILYSERTGSDLTQIRRKQGAGKAAEEFEPHFEGIEFDGRFVVIYSKQDIACALEGMPGPPGCVVYSFPDAAKLAINVALYSLLQ